METHHADEGLSTTGGYAMIPGWVAERLRELGSAAAWAVYYELAHRAAKKRFAWPSQACIAADTGLAERSVERAIRALKEIGAITVKPRVIPGKGKCGNIYTIAFHDPSNTQPDTGGGTAQQDVPRPDMGDGYLPDTDGGSLNKDELEKYEPQKVNPPTPQTEIALSKQESPNSENGHTPIPESPNPKEKALRAESIGEPDPEWADLWAEWLDDRRERKLPNTARALNRQLELLRKDRDPRDVLETAMRCAWKGLFPSKKPAPIQENEIPIAERHAARLKRWGLSQ